MLNDQIHRLFLHRHSDTRFDIICNQRRWTVLRHDRFEAIESSSEGSGCVLAPMPGKVLQIQVEPGDPVQQGQTLALMEAMKMELSIKAEVDGVIATVSVAEHDVIEAETLMIEIDSE